MRRHRISVRFVPVTTRWRSDAHAVRLPDAKEGKSSEMMKNTRIAQGVEFVEDIHSPPVTNISPVTKILDNTSAIREIPHLTE
ncbi:hypothetical protein AVEN_155574-1 [Araneus ventricosus]|uniref:Uncharacterized protein n=1 Tax=Araneus ventricosus TaxID=182803 RepID=A0A4Y2IQ95_ARAVE|nr:hypothetical protein AVEN_155574-1 [Araneus ventricosus]